MKMRFLSWFLMCFLCLSSSNGFSTDVIVKFKPHLLSLQSFDTLTDSISTTDIYTTHLLPELKIISFKDKSLDEVLALLRNHPSVEYAEPNFKIRLFKDEEEEETPPSWPFPDFPFPWPGKDGEKFPFPWPPDNGEDGNTPPPTVGDPLPMDPPNHFTPQKDPKLYTNWGIKKTNAPTAWKISKGSKNIIVGIIDTGIDYNHEDLSYNIYRNPKEIPNNNIDDDKNGFIDDVVGWDFVHNDSLPYDDHRHGTHVAGIIGAVGNNGIGISGINQEVTLLSVKAFDAQGNGEVATAIKAIEFAILQGAKVLNNSWGDYGFSQALVDVVGQAEKTVTVVCAAGNETNNNDKTAVFPASIQKENVISVAASTSNDQLAMFSNYGEKTVHLAAPGEYIFSTVPDNKYEYLDGTSMASPFVAGASALILSKYPDLKPKEIKERLMSLVVAQDSFDKKTVSGGRLDLSQF